MEDSRECLRLLESCGVCEGPLGRTAKPSPRGTYRFWDETGDIELDDVQPIRLCDRCASKDSGQILTKTDAKRRYAMTDADLVSLPHIEVRNPHYRRASDMKLFVRKYVKSAALRKHGGKEGLVKRRERNRRAGEKRSHTIQRAKDARKIELTAALADRGLELRPDSRLCEEYVERGRHTLEFVVDTMEEMRFFHRHTNYVEFMRDIKDEYRECGERWDHDQVSEEAKQRALDDWTENGGQNDDTLGILPRSLHTHL